MDQYKSKKRKLPITQIMIGIIILIVGTLLLLETTDLAETRHLSYYFPSLLIILGIWMLIRSKLQSLFFSIFMILVGIGWQLVALDYVPADEIFNFWPVVLILLGLYFILGHFRSKAKESKSEYTSTFTIFGDVNKKNTTENLRGVEITSFISDVKIDLSKADMKKPPARINLALVLSDADITVLEDWNVKLEALPILADTIDKRAEREDEHEDVDLVISGWCLLSDVYIR